MEAIKRVNYFKGQHLRVTDFKEEQDYHIEMRRLHNRWLHTWGIAYGFFVNKNSDSELLITGGFALDSDGREIALLEDEFILDIRSFSEKKNGSYYLTISYNQELSNHSIQSLCQNQMNRISENYIFQLIDSKTFIHIGIEIPLAILVLNDCKIEELDTGVRQLAGYTEIGCVRRVGDTMTGQLIIDRSDFIGNEGIKHLHLKALVDPDNPQRNEEYSPVISTNKDWIQFRSIKEDSEDSSAGLKIGALYIDGSIRTRTDEEAGAALNILPNSDEKWIKMGPGGDGGRVWIEYHEAGSGEEPAPYLIFSDKDDAPRIQFQQTGTGTEEEPQFKCWIGNAGSLNSNNANDLALMGNKVGIGTTDNLQEQLEVDGEIRFGAHRNVYAIGAPEGRIRVIMGRVAANGDIVSGDKFTSEKLGTGHYKVSFYTISYGFESNPIVMVTASHVSSKDDNVANTFNISTASFEVVIMDIDPNTNQKEEDSDFDFIAIGKY